MALVTMASKRRPVSVAPQIELGSADGVEVRVLIHQRRLREVGRDVERGWSSRAH